MSLSRHSVIGRKHSAQRKLDEGRLEAAICYFLRTKFLGYVPTPEKKNCDSELSSGSHEKAKSISSLQ